MRRPYFQDPRRSHKQHGNLNGEATTDFRDAFVPDRIAGKVNCVLRRFPKGQRKPCDRAAISSNRSMPRRYRGHLQYATIWGRQVSALPGDKTDGGAAQSVGAGLCGQNRSRTLEQSASRAIKIIKVMVVAEQDSVYATKRLRFKRGTYSFTQRVKAGRIFLARRVKRRIGKQPQSAQFK